MILSVNVNTSNQNLIAAGANKKIPLSLDKILIHLSAWAVDNF